MLCTYEIMFSSISLMIDMKNNYKTASLKEIVIKMKVINMVHACIWSPCIFYVWHYLEI